jgi:hypothetical protein
MIEHPFSLGLSDYQGREDLGERLDALLVAFEFLLRVNALVLGSTFLQNENCRDDKVRGLLTHPIYHLSDWYVLLQSLLAVLPSALFPRLRRWFILMEKQCRKKQVPSLLTKNCTRQAFQNLLAIRNRRAHNERRVQSDFVQDNLALAECCFKYCLAEFPPLGNLYIDGQGRMSYHSEDLDICCEPLLLPGTLVGQPHSVLMYAGCGPKGQPFQHGRLFAIL